MASSYCTARFGKSHLFPMSIVTTRESQCSSIFLYHLSKSLNVSYFVKSKTKNAPAVPLKNKPAIASNFSWPRVSHTCNSAIYVGTEFGIVNNLCCIFTWRLRFSFSSNSSLTYFYIILVLPTVEFPINISLNMKSVVLS